MTESTDEKLKRQLAAALQSDLAGCEFTPNMRQAVLDKVKQLDGKTEEQQQKPRRNLRPILTWSAVAAAALLFAVNTQFGSRPKSAADHAGPSALAQESANTRAAGPTGNAGGSSSTAAGNPTDSAGQAGSPKAASQGETNAATSTLKLPVKARPVWERPLAGITDQSRLSVSADGHVAVAAGKAVYMMKPDGAVEWILTLSQPAYSAAWSGDGRFAVAAGGDVIAYQGTQQQFQVPIGPGAEVSFGPDGQLAALSGTGAERRVSLLNREGVLLSQLTTPTTGRGIVFANGGAVVVAGDRAYSRSGDPAWQAPVQPKGIAALLGGNSLVMWDAESIVGAKPEDGKAPWSIRVSGGGEGLTTGSASSDGRFAAVLLRPESGPEVWILDATGLIRYREHLAAMPYHAALAGNTLLLLMPNSVRAFDLEGL